MTRESDSLSVNLRRVLKERTGLFSVEISYSSDEQWDKRILLGKTESLYLFHSTPWADRLNELLNYKPVYFSIFKDDKPQLSLLGFIDSGSAAWQGGIIETAKQLVKKTMLLATNCRYFKWYGQPIYYQENHTESYNILANSLKEYLEHERLNLVGGEWPITQRLALPSDWKTREWATLKVDLTRDLNDLFNGFKQAARKEISKAAKKGVIVKKVMTIGELETYYEVATIWARRYGKRLLGFEDFATMWRHFRGWGCFETFVAYHDEKMIGGLSVWGDKHHLMEIGAFQSEESFQKKLGSSDLLKWEALQWGKSIGALSFDLAGVNPNPETEKEKNIRRFKEKWSNELHQYLIVSTNKL